MCLPTDCIFNSALSVLSLKEITHMLCRANKMCKPRKWFIIAACLYSNLLTLLCRFSWNYIHLLLSTFTMNLSLVPITCQPTCDVHVVASSNWQYSRGPWHHSSPLQIDVHMYKIFSSLTTASFPAKLNLPRFCRQADSQWMGQIRIWR